jgi:hypothetical protein
VKTKKEMLRIRLSVSNTLELIPTDYVLIADKYQGFTENIKSKKYHYNANYLKGGFSGNWTLCTVYYRRKLNLGACTDGSVTSIDVGRGGEFYDVNGMDALKLKGKYYVCQEKRYLTTIKQTNPEVYQQGKKRKIPSFLFVNNLADLRKTVHFELTWSDNVTMHLTGQVGNVIDMEFNMYAEENEL